MAAEESGKVQASAEWTYHYLVILPEGYDSSREWPLLYFLHGSGERGSDLQAVKRFGPFDYVKENKLPFIIVAPQCPANEFWQPCMTELVLDQVERDYPVDKSREYITGMSMGGTGAYMLAGQLPDRFAAMAVLCGPARASVAAGLTKMPIWIFQGALDENVNPVNSQLMYDAIKAAGGDVELTVYPDLEHNIWARTYQRQDLYEWFLSHKK